MAPQVNRRAIEGKKIKDEKRGNQIPRKFKEVHMNALIKKRYDPLLKGQTATFGTKHSNVKINPNGEIIYKFGNKTKKIKVKPQQSARIGNYLGKLILTQKSATSRGVRSKITVLGEAIKGFAKITEKKGIAKGGEVKFVTVPFQKEVVMFRGGGKALHNVAGEPKLTNNKGLFTVPVVDMVGNRIKYNSRIYNDISNLLATKTARKVTREKRK